MMTKEDMRLQSVNDILTILKEKIPSLNLPTLKYGHEETNAMEHLASLFKSMVPQMTPKTATINPSEILASVPRVIPRTMPQNVTINPPKDPAPVPREQTPVDARLITNIPLIVSRCPVANHIYNPTTGQRETIDTLLAGTNSNIW